MTRPFADYFERPEPRAPRTYECKDCRVPMTPRHHLRADGLCATCRKERSYEPPPEVAYQVGLCQTQYTDTWPFFAPDGERKGSRDMHQRVALAKEICALCPCRAACKEWALKQGCNLYGIWGGTTRHERALLRRAGEVAC